MSNDNAQTAAAERRSFLSGLWWGVRLALSLFAITAVAALVLSLVNSLTAPTIADRAEAARLAAMSSVSPGADVFSELYCEDESIDRISGAYAGTRFVGYCVEVSPNGFGGPIHLMVGVDDGGSVTGVAILDHEETPGLGARTASPAFLDQFLDKSGTITVNSGSNAIDGISGATISSRAVTEGVNAALTVAFNYSEEGGQLPDEEGD